MSVTPYIWALWHTDFGKFIIILFIIYLIIYALGWWTIPILIALAIALGVYFYIDNRKHKKLIQEFQHKEELKESLTKKLRNEFPYAIIDRYSFTEGEDGLRLFWLVIGKTGERPIELDNGIFKVKFKMAANRRGVIMFLENTSDNTIQIDKKSYKINSKAVEQQKDKMWYEYGYGWEDIQPGEKIERILKTKEEYYKNGEIIRLFESDVMKKIEVKCTVSFSIKTENDKVKDYSFDLYSQTRFFRLE